MEADKTTSTQKPSKASATDHLANERTFLAWIRTGIAIMGFGFVVVKFSLFMRQLSLALGKQLALPSRGYSPVIGVSLVVIGAIMSLLAFFRYRHIEKHLRNGIYFPSFLLSLLLTIAIVVISILLVLYLTSV